MDFLNTELRAKFKEKNGKRWWKCGAPSCPGCLATVEQNASSGTLHLVLPSGFDLYKDGHFAKSNRVGARSATSSYKRGLAKKVLENTSQLSNIEKREVKIIGRDFEGLAQDMLHSEQHRRAPEQIALIAPNQPALNHDILQQLKSHRSPLDRFVIPAKVACTRCGRMSIIPSVIG